MHKGYNKYRPGLMAYIDQALASCDIKVNGQPLSAYKPEPIQANIADAIFEQAPRVRDGRASKALSTRCYGKVGHKWLKRFKKDTKCWKTRRTLKWRNIVTV